MKVGLIDDLMDENVFHNYYNYFKPVFVRIDDIRNDMFWLSIFVKTAGVDLEIR